MRIVLLILLTFPALVFAQGGHTVNFRFLSNPSSARLQALGGVFSATLDGDENMVYSNPATIDFTMNGNLSASIALFPSDIQYGTFNYFPNNKGKYLWSFGTKFMNYGSMSSYDIDGIKTGRISAAENALFTSVRGEFEGVQVGATCKFISSFYGSYNAFGVSADIAAVYAFDSNRSVLAAKISDFGIGLKSFSENEKLVMPTNIQLSYSRRLEHLPLRLFVTVDHLNRWNILYEDPLNASNVVVINDTTQSTPSEFIPNLARHLTFGSELQLGKGFFFRLGYNLGRRNEMKIPSFLSSVGLSWGLELRFKRWNIAMSRSKYHLAASPMNFSFVFKL